MRTVIFCLCFLMFYGISIAQDYRFGKVSEEEIKQKEHPSDPSAEAAILYRETKSEFVYSRVKGWFLETEYFERIKIYSKEGLKYANKTVDLYKGEQNDEIKKIRAFTYNLDSGGKINRVKLESNGIINEEVNHHLNQTKITMPDVQEGSVIEIRYAIESPFIMHIDEYKFQEKIPVDKIYMTFSAPERFRFKTYHRGWLPIDVKQNFSEKTFTLMVEEVIEDKNTMGFPRTVNRPQKVKMKHIDYTIEMTDVPAIEEEPFAGNIENYMSGIQFELGSAEIETGIKSYSVSWDDVSKTIYQADAFGGELQRNNYFKKDLDQLLEGVSDPEKKTDIIYDYVQEKMHWNQNLGVFTKDGVRKAYRENTGNAAEINLMLTAMLKYANVKAYPVLVSTKSNGIPLFPTITGFNYVITAVELPQQMLLLDATNKNAEKGVLGSYVMNWNGRIFKDDHSDWISLNPVIPAVNQTLLNIQVNPELEIYGNVQQRFSGNYALNYRNRFRNIADSEWKKKIENTYGRIELSDISFQNLNQSNEAVVLNFDFETVEGIEEVGGKIFMSPLLFLKNKENPFKSDSRKYPIDFGFPYRYQTIMNFTIPDGFEVEFLPENAMSTLGEMGSYKYLISHSRNIIQVSVDLTINQAFVAESDYEGLKNFFEFLVAKESEKIVFKRS